MLYCVFKWIHKNTTFKILTFFSYRMPRHVFLEDFVIIIFSYIADLHYHNNDNFVCWHVGVKNRCFLKGLDLVQVWICFERAVFYQEFPDQDKNSIEYSSNWIGITLSSSWFLLTLLASLIGSSSMLYSKLPSTTLWVLPPIEMQYFKKWNMYRVLTNLRI